MVRKLSGIFLGLIGVGFVGIGLLFFTGTSRQKESDEMFKERFAPIISYIEDFHSDNNRYPNRAEFENWKENNRFENKAVFLYVASLPCDPAFKAQITKNKEYIISMWRGEWDVFYIAQEQRFYPRDWGYDSAFMQLLFCAAIGSIFIFPSWLLLRTKQTRTQQ